MIACSNYDPYGPRYLKNEHVDWDEYLEFVSERLYFIVKSEQGLTHLQVCDLMYEKERAQVISILQIAFKTFTGMKWKQFGQVVCGHVPRNNYLTQHRRNAFLRDQQVSLQMIERVLISERVVSDVQKLAQQIYQCLHGKAYQKMRLRGQQETDPQIRFHHVSSSVSAPKKAQRLAREAERKALKQMQKSRNRRLK